MEYRNQAFEGVTITLDGNSYFGCSFKNVVFHYSGGDVTIQECGMDHFSFQFGGQLANGMFMLYQMFGTEGMIKIIKGFTEPTEGQIEL